MSKEKGSSFEEIQASGKCIVPLYFCILSSSTPADAEATMDTGEEEDVEQSSGDHDDEDIDVDSDDDYED